MSISAIRSFKAQTTKPQVSSAAVKKAQGILRQLAAAGHNPDTYHSGAAARETLAKNAGK